MMDIRTVNYIAFACIVFGIAMLMYYLGVKDALNYRKFVEENCYCSQPIANVTWYP